MSPNRVLIFVAAQLLLLVSAPRCAVAAEPAEKAAEKEASTANGDVPVPVKVLRYAQHLIDKHDQDGDGQLDERERPSLGAGLSGADRNGDKVITLEELAQRVARYGARRKIRLMPFATSDEMRLPSLLHQSGDAKLPPPETSAAGGLSGVAEEGKPTRSPAAAAPAFRKYFVPRSRLPEGLPKWFVERDADGDGQLTLAEYAPHASTALLREFSGLDLNHDGLMTPAEVMAATRRARPAASEKPAAGETPAASRATEARLEPAKQ